MSQEYERKLEEWAVWWEERKNEHIPVEKKIVVTAKMIEGLFDLFAYIARDLRRAEGRRQNIEANGDRGPGSVLWLPHGMTHFRDKKVKNPDDEDEWMVPGE